MSNPVSYDMEESLSANDPVEISTEDVVVTPVAPKVEVPDGRIEALKEALRISEGARADMLNRAVPQQPQQQPQQKWYNRDELRDMLNDEDSNVRMQAVEISNAQAIQQAAHHFEQRLGSLTSGSLQSAEASARQRYAQEFELFGDQIRHLVANIPDKTALTQPAGWDNLLAYVRGQQDNFDKLYEARSAARARETESAALGHVFTPTPNSQGGANFQLDAHTKEVAQTLIDAGIYPDINAYIKDMKGFTNYANG